MLVKKFKPRKCRLSGCNEIFTPTTEWHWFHSARCRSSAQYRRRAALVRKGERAVEQEIKAKAVGE